MSGFKEPLSVAAWLCNNTSLSFDRIAQVCRVKVKEVEDIADGVVEPMVINPLETGEISAEELQAIHDDPSRLPKLTNFSDQKNRRKKRNYVPVAKRRAKPDAILWLIKNYPELRIQQIVDLIGTTAKMVNSIKDSTYWNIASIKPRDPVLLRLCSQAQLEEVILKIKIASETKAREEKINEYLNTHPEDSLKKTHNFIEEFSSLEDLKGLDNASLSNSKDRP